MGQFSDKIIAIGASTGGTEAVSSILEQLPKMMPGILITQHMPKGFTKTFAERLNKTCKMEVKEAQHGDRVLPGRVLLAEGDSHMTLRRSGNIYLVDCKYGEKVCGHRPSVDVLFESVGNVPFLPLRHDL